MTVPAHAAAAVVRASAHGRTSRVTLARALARSVGRSFARKHAAAAAVSEAAAAAERENGENKLQIQIQTTARDGKTVGDPKE